MKSRCYNPRTRSFQDYGKRGIEMCSRWRDSFESFVADMGPKPTPRHTVDRIDNDGNYEPGNCRWATRTQQNRNKPGLKLDEAKAAEIRRRSQAGELQKDVAEAFGVSPALVSAIARGEAWA